MRRTPLWVFAAAAGLQLAALGLCLWAMERSRLTEIHDDDAAAVPPAPPRPRAQTEALAPAPPLAAANAAFVHPVEPPEPSEIRASEPPPARAAEPEPEPAAEPAPDRSAPRAVIHAAPAPPVAAPMFGPPPDRPPAPLDSNGISPFLTEAADELAQIVCGKAAEGQIAFGFYADGNIRFVDVDGARYAGKAESARARMREVDGMRAFTVQIGAAEDYRLQATFTGGPHDTQTFPLEPLAGWSMA